MYSPLYLFPITQHYLRANIMTKTTTQYHIAYILLITLLCLYGFKGITTHPWSYDDLDHIKHAQIAQSDLLHIVAPNVKEPSRIVLNTYFFIAYKFFGHNPSAYHATKIAFHILNSLLLAYVFLSLFKDPKLAALSGLIFAIHGTHYEAIYHIAGTGYLLCTFFALLALLFTHQSLTRKSNAITIAAILSYGFAIFSYEGGIVILIPLLFIWLTSTKGKNTYHFPILLVCVAMTFFVIEKWGFGYINTKVAFYDVGIGWHIPHTFLLFIGRLFINSHITPFGWTSLPPKDIPRDDMTLYVAAGVLIFGLLLYLSKKPGPIRFFTLWIAITILPTTLGTHDYYYTRYFYLPAIGASGITATFLLWIFNTIPIASHTKRPVFIFTLTILTLAGLHKLHIFEGYFLFNTANYYASPNYANDPKLAIIHYERAKLEYNVKDHVLALNLASCYEKTNQNIKALENYQEAIHINPNDARSHHAIARLYLHKGQITDAILSAQKAAQLNTHFVTEYHKLGTLLYNQNHIAEAHQIFQTALKIAPNHPHNDLIHFNLAALYQNQGKQSDAIQAYEKAKALKTNIVEVYQNLGALYVQNQHWTQAIETLTQATNRDANNAQIWHLLAHALTQEGRHTAAQSAYINAKRAQSTP